MLASSRSKPSQLGEAEPALVVGSAGRSRAARHESLWEPYMYLLPGLLIFGLFVALPLGGTIALSFTEWDGYGSPLFTGLSNYADAASDPLFRSAAWHNLLLIPYFAVLPRSAASRSRSADEATLGAPLPRRALPAVHHAGGADRRGLAVAAQPCIRSSQRGAEDHRRESAHLAGRLPISPADRGADWRLGSLWILLRCLPGGDAEDSARVVRGGTARWRQRPGGVPDGDVAGTAARDGGGAVRQPHQCIARLRCDCGHDRRRAGTRDERRRSAHDR